MMLFLSFARKTRSCLWPGTKYTFYLFSYLLVEINMLDVVSTSQLIR